MDHLVSACQHTSRNRQADLLCCFQVDGQFKLSQLLQRQASGLGAFEKISHLGML